jgi:hypothetical protein
VKLRNSCSAWSVGIEAPTGARCRAAAHPASALIFNQSGLRVARVTPDDKILFKTVTIARELGREIELASGVTAEDRIVTAPPDSLADCDQVRVVGAPKPPSLRRHRKSRT